MNNDDNTIIANVEHVQRSAKICSLIGAYIYHKPDNRAPRVKVLQYYPLQTVLPPYRLDLYISIYTYVYIVRLNNNYCGQKNKSQ